MTYTLYLDIYFLVNFIMDILLLSMVRRILKLPLKKRKLVVAGIAGAIWACTLVYVPALSGWLEILVTWVVGGGMLVFLAYGSMSISEFGKTLCTLWLVSAAAGGALGALGDHKASGTYLTGGLVPTHFSVISLLCWIAGIYFGICACILFVKKQIQERKYLYEVTLSYRGRKKVVTALLDTGNRLYEPYGQEPVHVITYDACKQLCESVSQVIYIPYRAVGTESGMLPAIQVDEMEVAQEGKIVMVLKKPWLAISKEPLSAKHRYDMLLNGENEK